MDKRRFFFTQYIISLWNSLLLDVVIISSLGSFKGGLGKFISGY